MAKSIKLASTFGALFGTVMTAISAPPGGGAANPPQSKVENSSISNEQRGGTARANENSAANTGVAARSSTIIDSNIRSSSSGSVSAGNNSNANSGVSIGDGGGHDTREDSSSQSTAVVRASVRSAAVKSESSLPGGGVPLQPQAVQIDVKSGTSTTIVDPLQPGGPRKDILVNSMALQGGQQGGIAVKNNNDLTGGAGGNYNPGLMPDDRSLAGKAPGDAPQNTATLNVDTNTVQDVEVIIADGGGKIGQSIKNSHMGALYKNKLAHDGTYYWYISKVDYEKALFDGKSFGTVTVNDPRVKKIKIIVE